MNKPNEVLHAVLAIWVALAIMVIELLVKIFVNLPKMKSQMGASPISPELLATLTLVLSFSIPAFLAIMIDKGKNWARYLFLFVFVLGTLMYLNSILTGFSFGILDSLSAIAQTGLQVYALLLLFKYPAKEWFRKKEV